MALVRTLTILGLSACFTACSDNTQIERLQASLDEQAEILELLRRTHEDALEAARRASEQQAAVSAALLQQKDELISSQASEVARLQQESQAHKAELDQLRTDHEGLQKKLSELERPVAPKPTKTGLRLVLKRKLLEAIRQRSFNADDFDSLKDVIRDVKKQAWEGDADSQFIRGLLHATGIGATRDAAEALKWIRLSYSSGNKKGNPFEASVPVLTDLVPRGVNFFVRKQNLANDFAPFPEPKFWAGLSESAAFDAVRAGPLGRRFQQDGLDRALASASEQLSRIARDSGGFLDVVRDVIGSEVVLAGYNQDYSVTPPRPLPVPHWCLYTRIGEPVKLLVDISSTPAAKLALAKTGMRLDFDGESMVLTPPGGSPIYVRRHLDALMVANEPSLIEQSELLIRGDDEVEPIGLQSAYADGALARIDEWAMRNDVDELNVLEFLVEPHAYDIFRRFAASWPAPSNRDSIQEHVLASFLNPNAWMQVAGGFIFEDDYLGATGEIRLNSRGHTPFQRSFYTPEQQRREQWLDPFLSIVPESACGAAALRIGSNESLAGALALLDDDEDSLLADALRTLTSPGIPAGTMAKLVSRVSQVCQPRLGVIARRGASSQDAHSGGGAKTRSAVTSASLQVAIVFWFRPGNSISPESLKQALDKGRQTLDVVPIPGGAGTEVTGPLPEQLIRLGPSSDAPMAMAASDRFFIASNSTALTSDILRTFHKDKTGMRAIRQTEHFASYERNLPPLLNGFVWIDGQGLQYVIDDHLALVDSDREPMDPEWVKLTRPQVEVLVRRRHYPQYPSKASMPRSLIQLGGEFDQKVTAELRAKWNRERANFTDKDRDELLQLRSMCELFPVLALQLEMEESLIHYQLKMTTNF